MRDNRLSRGAGTDATTPAAGIILSDQRLYDIELAALLDKDATAAPVAAAALTRHGLVVGDVNLVGRARLSPNNAGSTGGNTETTALGVYRFVAGNRAASHGERDDWLTIETSVDSATGLIGAIGSNGTTRHSQRSTVRRCNATAAEQAEVLKVGISNASVSSVVSYAGRAANGYGCTLGINTTTVPTAVGVKAIVDFIGICCIARNDTAGEIQRDTAVGKNATTGSSLIRCDHSAGHVDRDFRARYAQAAAPAATLLIEIRASNKTAIDIHMSFVAFPLGKDDMTVVGQIPRCRDHATVEVKRAAIRNRDDLLDAATIAPKPLTTCIVVVSMVPGPSDLGVLVVS